MHLKKAYFENLSNLSNFKLNLCENYRVFCTCGQSKLSYADSNCLKCRVLKLLKNRVRRKFEVRRKKVSEKKTRE